MTIEFADSSGINLALRAEPRGNDGRGVCSCLEFLPLCSDCRALVNADIYQSDNKNPLGHINRDKTGLKTVRKGCTVDYSGVRFAVKRVRQGIAYGETLLQKQYFHAPTSAVRVVL